MLTPTFLPTQWIKPLTPVTRTTDQGEIKTDVKSPTLCITLKRSSQKTQRFVIRKVVLVFKVGVGCVRTYTWGVCTRMCVCLRVHVCARENEREREKERERETHAHTHTHTHTHTHICARVHAPTRSRNCFYLITNFPILFRRC